MPVKKLSRRSFNESLLRSALTLAFVKGLNKVDVLASPVRPIVRRWLVEMESASHELRRGRLKPVDWQEQIESLLSHVDLKDLLEAVDYDKLSRAAVFPEDHESADDISFTRTRNLPSELSFAPYFYALRKGVAIVPHGHRNMTSMHMMLNGQAHGRQFERVYDEEKYLTIQPTLDKVLEVGAVTTISDQKDNIHWFKALSEPVFMFNIAVFGISAAKGFTGRDYVDPLGGERLGNGMVRVRRIGKDEAYRIYGRT